MVAAKKPIDTRERRPTLSIPQRSSVRTRLRAHPHTTATASATAANTITPNHLATEPAGTVRPSTAKILTGLSRLSFAKKAAIIGVISLGVIGLSLYHHDTALTSRSNNPNNVIENLEYQTVLPSGKSIDALGGWKRVSPSGTDPVYAYVDNISGIPVSVSQQPLPASFKNDVDGQVGELAKKFNATTKLDAGDVKVYLGTSAKGPQSVILTKNSLLILIKSQEKIDDSAWIDYAKSLN